MRNIEAALEWIVKILEERKMPFQIDGGLAAKIYGSDRPLADIDIIVHNKDIELLALILKDYIKFGPEKFHDDNWDLLLLMTLEYMDQLIDISGAEEAKIFDKNTSDWVAIETDFDKPEIRELFGMHLPVIPKEQLVREKSKLLRPVDIEDIKAII